MSLKMSNHLLNDAARSAKGVDERAPFGHDGLDDLLPLLALVRPLLDALEREDLLVLRAACPTFTKAINS
jgi:hypothetical protein